MCGTSGSNELFTSRWPKCFERVSGGCNKDSGKHRRGDTHRKVVYSEDVWFLSAYVGYSCDLCVNVSRCCMARLVLCITSWSLWWLPWLQSVVTRRLTGPRTSTFSTWNRFSPSQEHVLIKSLGFLLFFSLHPLWFFFAFFLWNEIVAKCSVHAQKCEHI